MFRKNFNVLVQQQSRKLYGFAFRILRNQEEAEDAVQEIFIKLWNMREKLGDYRSVDALAMTMTRNYCIDILRKQKHDYKGDFDEHILNKLTYPSPHDHLEIRETDKILNIIIDKMPESIRSVLKLRDIEGMSYEELAEKTGLNINTLRVNLSRARKHIRDEYNKYQYERKGAEQTY